MRAFIVRDHDLFWSACGGSVVFAETEAEAIRLLDAALVNAGLKPFDAAPYTLNEIEMCGAHIVHDGEY